MLRFASRALLLTAAIGLTGCSVSQKDENGVRTVDIETNIGGLKADVDTGRGGNVSINGDEATVDFGNGSLRATVRTDENRSISVTTNQQ